MKMNKMVLVLLTVIMAACGPAKQSTNMEDTSSENQKRLSFELLVQHSHGGYDKPQIKVIKEPTELQEIYAKINMTRRPGFPIPEVDFDTEMIIGLYMGEKNTGGFSIGIDSVEETKKELIIHVKETTPEGGMVTMAICQPFCIVKMPATKKEIVFKKVS